MENFNGLELKDSRSHSIKKWKVKNTNEIEFEEETYVYFRDIKKNLINHIESIAGPPINNIAIFGAVAWITDYDILDSLSKVPNVFMIVQKEDFLRPEFNMQDSDKYRKWKEILKEKYSKLKNNMERHTLPDPLGRMSVCSDPEISPVRCVGNYNRNGSFAFPRMHNKFLIFAFIDSWEGVDEVNPFGVWTGSFNFTRNAGNSFENALYLKNKKIVKAYFKEYLQIACFTEPLNWENDWIEPEWRLGT